MMRYGCLFDLELDVHIILIRTSPLNRIRSVRADRSSEFGSIEGLDDIVEFHRARGAGQDHMQLSGKSHPVQIERLLGIRWRD